MNARSPPADAVRRNACRVAPGQGVLIENPEYLFDVLSGDAVPVLEPAIFSSRKKLFAPTCRKEALKRGNLAKCCYENFKKNSLMIRCKTKSIVK